MIKLDVSEVKSILDCPRKWQFTSRNRYHVRPRVKSIALELGTSFHTALAQLYYSNGANRESVLKMVVKEVELQPELKPLIAMVDGYCAEVLDEDLKNWKILAVEHVFEFPSGLQPSTKVAICPDCGDVGTELHEGPTRDEDIFACTECGRVLTLEAEEVVCVGAIDLIVYEYATNTVKGIEHKTCAQFRDPAFAFIDAQPRLYHKALDYYIIKAKQEGLVPQDAFNGGIILNEVKKLKRDFQYNRIPCIYSPDDIEGFWAKWQQKLDYCRKRILQPQDELPSPNYFGCKLCPFLSVCGMYGYAPISEQQLLRDFAVEYEKRTIDHLEEKIIEEAL